MKSTIILIRRLVLASVLPLLHTNLVHEALNPRMTFQISWLLHRLGDPYTSLPRPGITPGLIQSEWQAGLKFWHNMYVLVQYKGFLCSFANEKVNATTAMRTAEQLNGWKCSTSKDSGDSHYVVLCLQLMLLGGKNLIMKAFLYWRLYGFPNNDISYLEDEKICYWYPFVGIIMVSRLLIASLQASATIGCIDTCILISIRILHIHAYTKIWL